jgi:hypothetical protein
MKAVPNPNPNPLLKVCGRLGPIPSNSLTNHIRPPRLELGLGLV